MATLHKFPLNDQDDYKGRIIFTAYDEDYKTLGQAGFEALTSAAGEILSEEQRAEIQKLQGNEPSQRTASSGASQKQPGRSVQMYLPTTLQFADRVEYTNVDLGIVGSAAALAIQRGAGGGDLAREIMSKSLPDFESFKDLVQTGLQSEGAQVAALRIAGRINGAVQGAVETSTGIALNPNRRSTLRGIGIRRFQFTFKMIPTSQQEAREVGNIVQFFRREMYPETKALPGTAIQAALKFPAKFRIKMRYGTRNVATGILPCFLESVNTTYNPNAMAFHKDGEFQETDITLSFVEERALTKSDIEGGY